MLKAVFFDIDRTLLDHNKAEKCGIEDIYKKNKTLFSHMPFPSFHSLWSEESEKYMQQYLAGQISFEKQRIKRLQAVFKQFQVELSPSEALNVFSHYLSIYEDSWQCFNDVLPCLNELQASYQLGIISNGNHDQQIKKLNKLTIFDYFKHVITSGSLGVSKPDERIFLAACNASNLEPKNIVYVGDNYETDIVPARALGIETILIDRENKYESINSPRVTSLEGCKEILFR